MTIEPKQLVTLAAALIGTGAMCLYAREIGEAIRNFRGGGPRPPSHPLPADDGFVLRRRRQRSD